MTIKDGVDVHSSPALNNILSLITEAIIVFNLDGKITGLNQAASSLYQIHSEEVLGRGIMEVVPDFFGLDSLKIKDIIGLIKEQRFWCNQVVHTFKNGRKTTVRINYTSFIEPVTGEGEVVAIIRDIGDQTERDRQQAYQRQLIQNVSYVGVILANNQGNVVHANDTAIDLFDQDSQSIRKQSLQTLLGPSQKIDIPKVLSQVLAGRDFTTEIIKKHSTGNKWLSVKVSRQPENSDGLGQLVCLVEDITERKQAQNRLEAIQNRLHLILSATNEVLWNWDMVHDEIWWSEGIAEHFGYTVEKIGPTPQWWKQKIHPEDRERVITTLKLALKDERESLAQEYRFQKADGSYATVHDRASIMYDAGRPVRAVGAIMDITVQQVAERALHLSLSRFKILFDQSPMSSQVFDPEGNTLMVNPAWEKLWGLSFDQLNNYNIRKDPQLEKNGIAPLIEKAFHGEAQTLPEIHYQTQKTLEGTSGHDRWVKAFIYPIMDNDGNVKEVVLVHEDVSEAKQAQIKLEKALLRYQTLFNSRITGVMVVDNKGTVYVANDRLLKLLGYSRQEFEAGDINWMDLTPLKWRDRDLTALKKLLKKGQIPPYEKEYITKEGVPVPVMVGFAALDGSDKRYLALVVDNRKQKKAELEIVKAKNQLSVILQNIADGITVQNAKGEVVFANQKAALLSGFSNSSEMMNSTQKTLLKNRQRFSLYTENGEQFPQDQLPGQLALKHKKESEAVVHCIDNITHESRWSHIKAQPIVNEAGEVDQAVNIITDITPRKQLEELLQFKSEVSRILSSSFDYQETITKIAEMAVKKVADWFVVDLNERDGWQTIAITHKTKTKTKWAKGYLKANQTILHKYLGVYNSIETGKSKLIPKAFKVFDLLVKEDQSLEYIHKKFAVKSIIQVPIIVKEKVIGVITLASSESLRKYTDSEKDLAEQLAGRMALAIENSHLYHDIRSQQERLEKLVAHVPGVVWEAWGNPSQKKQRINFVSRYVKKMIGYTPKEWLNTPNFWLQIVHPDDRERAAKELSALYLSGKGGVSRFRWIAKNGNVLWVESHTDVIKDRNGQPIGMRGVIMDVSERMETEQRKDDFISMASHELKTPVTSIKVFTQILTRMFAAQNQEKPVEYLKKMDIQVNRLTTLVSELLNVSKIQAGRLELVKDKFDLNQLIFDIVETLQHNHPATEIVFKSPGTLNLKADQERVSQVLINLISNAIKYSPKKSQVKVFTKTENGQIIVSVADRGMGISKKHQAKIFDRFYRVYDDKDKTFPGLGMGLYISNEIIKRHGGKMWLQSSLGKGSTFSFSLPLK